MNDDVFFTTDPYGATLKVETLTDWRDGVTVTVGDETTAAITLNDAQAKALANALIDAGF